MTRTGCLEVRGNTVRVGTWIICLLKFSIIIIMTINRRRIDRLTVYFIYFVHRVLL